MAEPVPVVHLSEADYADDAKRRDWQKQGFATLGPFAGHPLNTECPGCRALSGIVPPAAPDG